MSECICEDVRAMRACPVHEPRKKTPADDAFVAAWLADLEPYEDYEVENDVKAVDIRSLLYRIEFEKAEREQAEARVKELQSNLAIVSGIISRQEVPRG
jgi:hypothetical protein